MNRSAWVHLFLFASAMTTSCAKSSTVRADSHESPGPLAPGNANNPFTLVYGGAIAKNEPGKVNMRTVTYKSTAPRISRPTGSPSMWTPP